ncbi:MAG: dihydroxy-acid dehydratase [Actinomycetota bacterium]|nr:dihydroxy-acid dehydratase [Actinomycetota bacterium]
MPRLGSSAHVAPEAAADGPLRLVRDGDLVHLDVDAGILDLLVAADELEGRRADLERPQAPARGYARLYARSVLQAPEGCDFDFLRHELLQHQD